MKKRCAIAALAASLAIYLVYQNEAVGVTHYTFSSPRVGSLDGFRIVHLSDIHNKPLGSRLVTSVARLDPDLVVITGDLVDSRHPRPDVAISLVSELTPLADVCYVTGNHEESLPTLMYNEVLESLASLGVHLLDGRSYRISSGDTNLNIIGLFDKKQFYIDSVSDLIRPDDFNILLNHRPQFAPYYAAAGIDLAFCGHAHGGQMRLPFIGGLIAPDQWFFPTYSEGVHRFGDRATVISRGLGNSCIPLRINNRPEIVCVTLKSDKK